jgi:hypothetical protein
MPVRARWVAGECHAPPSRIPRHAMRVENNELERLGGQCYSIYWTHPCFRRMYMSMYMHSIIIIVLLVFLSLFVGCVTCMRRQFQPSS